LLYSHGVLPAALLLRRWRRPGMAWSFCLFWSGESLLLVVHRFGTTVLRRNRHAGQR
jgi:hypothetical protein